MGIKEMVRDHRKVKFSFYRDKELWYTTEDGFEFPVPIEEIGTATFMAEDRGHFIYEVYQETYGDAG